jgi:hypothetical protein
MNAPLPKLYTSSDAALFMSVKVCTVRNECRRGKLGFVIVGGRFVRHTEEHLTAYLKQQDKPACAYPNPSPNSLDGSGSASGQSKQARTIPGAARGSTPVDVKSAVSALAQQTFARQPKRSRAGSQSGVRKRKYDHAA